MPVMHRPALAVNENDLQRRRSEFPQRLERVCENCAVPQPPQQAQKRRSLGTPIRDADLFSALPQHSACGFVLIS